jgi:hypothetical protein
MTSDKKSFLLAQLQEAIDQAVSESGRVSEIIAEMKNGGFDLCLILESTVTITPAGEPRVDSVPEPHRSFNEADFSGEMQLTDEDLAFLQELNIASV